MVAVGAVGIAVLGGPLEVVDVELAAVDDAVVAGRLHVTVEAGGQGFVGHDHRIGPSALGRLRLPHRNPEDVVDVAVGVDGGVEAIRRPGPQGAVDLRRRRRSCRCRPGTARPRCSTADTLANDGTKATPSATSASPVDGHRGWISAVVTSPFQSSSATASTSWASGNDGPPFGLGPCSPARWRSTRVGRGDTARDLSDASQVWQRTLVWRVTRTCPSVRSAGGVVGRHEPGGIFPASLPAP